MNEGFPYVMYILEIVFKQTVLENERLDNKL